MKEKLKNAWLWLKKRWASRTNKWTLVAGAFGFAEANLGLVKVYLGGHYEIVLFAVMFVNFYFRDITKTPVGEK